MTSKTIKNLVTSVYKIETKTKLENIHLNSKSKVLLFGHVT